MNTRMVGSWFAGTAAIALLSSCSLTAPSDDELMGGGGGATPKDASAELAEVGGKDAPSDKAVDVVVEVDAPSMPEASKDVHDAALPDTPVQDVACGTDQKVCGGVCVSKSDPAYGCEATGCQPCALAHAKVTCFASACKLESCDPGWTDCNVDPADGCEANLSQDPQNCGVCGQVCNLVHATAGCAAGDCTVASCSNGFGDCDQDPITGCEVNLQVELDNCGTCGKSCGGTDYQCLAGVCKITNCPPGQLDCDGNTANGCETPSTTAQNCGACGKTCDYPNATGQCVGGACQLGDCNSQWGNCNSLPGDGCEANLNTSLQNCGTCATPCVLANATSTCSGGQCLVSACDLGRGNCDGIAANGCEATTAADPLNCGVCGLACPSAPNAQPTCSSGACGLQCGAGWGNCNFQIADGCEVYTVISTENCGGCANTCPQGPNATAYCAASTCGFSCSTGYTDCDNNVLTGCEIHTAEDLNNCGTCGNVCPGGSVAACSAGQCGIACPTGTGDCDSNSANGCETDITSDVAHCGTCSTACSYAHATAACTSSQCTLGACDTGFANCDGQDATGCETATATNIAHCGSCNNACTSSLPQTTPACNNSTCGWQCVVGWGNCDNQSGNGCETNTQTSLQHCGSCNNPCLPPPHASADCVNGTCGLICLADYGNCDGLVSNGCETLLTTSSSHCGACGHSCATGACTNGYCSVEVLASGQNAANGLALDSNYVFFTTYTSPTLYARRVAKTGGTVANIETITNGSSGPGVAVFAGSTYWTVQGTSERVLKDTTTTGTAATVLASAETDPAAIATDGTWVFWTGDNTTAGTIRRVGTSGLGLISLATAQSSPRGIALDTTDVYWVSYGSGTVSRIKKDGSDPQPTVLVTGQVGPYYIAVDDSGMYWTDYGGSAIRKANKDGTGVTTLAAGESGARGIAIDASYVYWTSYANGTIRRVAKTGGAILTLAQGQSSPRQIAVDSTHAYWTNYIGDSVARVPK